MLKLEIPLVLVLAAAISLSLRCSCQAATTQRQRRCLPDQSTALLQFKKSFSFVGNGHDDKMASWNEGVDCCLWEGVTCDPSSGQVVGLDLSCYDVDDIYCRRIQQPNNESAIFLHLQHLRSLDLSHNDFNGSSISSVLSHLTSQLNHLNLSYAGLSGQIIPSRFTHLNKLVTFDLSFNFNCFGEDDSFSKLLANATELSVLRLQSVDMSKTKPSSLSNLSHSVTFIDLSDCGLVGDFPESVFRRPKLEQIDLAWNSKLSVRLPPSNWTGSPLRVLDAYETNLSTQTLPNSLGDLKLLTDLNLAEADLTGSIPASLWNLTSLTSLNLQFNSLSGSIPSSVGNMTSLTFLGLARNSLSGSVPSSIGNLTALNALTLSDNLFSGRFPDTLPSLVNLEWLRLQGNGFSGSFATIFGNLSQRLIYMAVSRNNFTGYIPSSIFRLPKLEILECANNQLVGSLPGDQGGLYNLRQIDLAGNFLNGTIPSWLLALPSLEVLGLASNRLTGEIPDFKSSSLQEIYLHQNQLSGPVPNSIFNLVNATIIRINANKLSGAFFLDNITRLKNLQTLSLSDNSISVVSSDVGASISNSTPSHELLNLELSSCNMTGISTSFLELHPSLSWLNLSRNLLTSLDVLPPLMEELVSLDLSYNSIRGPLTVPWSSQLSYLVLANNKLTGRIPQHFCHLASLVIVNLSNNTLNGNVPECLFNLTTLSVLNIRRNDFIGPIPTTLGNLSDLEYLDVNGNTLQGPLPETLAACKKIEVLDVGNNNINDVFPQWASSLPQLKVLILTSNHFNGPIVIVDRFPKLRIFDLSDNYFNGTLPASLFHKFPAMVTLQDFEKAGVNYYIERANYQYSVVLVVKGLEMTLHKVLTIFTTMDLSNNYFQGRIPDTIGELKSLRLLNLSHNMLNGPITTSLGNLTELESLDLSSNQLTGEIPWQLTSLTYLAFLNLSQNLLQGPIPQQGQWGTFLNTSYVGNEGLCGFPLSNKCGAGADDDDESSEPESESESESGGLFDWKFAGAGYGCGLVIGISTAYVMFTFRKPHWLVEMVDGWIRRHHEHRRWRQPITFKVR